MAVAPRETSATEAAAPPPAAPDARSPGARDALAILVALLALCGLAAALGGAGAVPDAAWVGAGAALVALATLAAWAADRRPPGELAARSGFARDVAAAGGVAVRATPLVWAGLAGVLALALWALASLAWSARPDLAWEVFNRELAYVLVAVCAVAAGASARRPVALALAAAGVVLVATLVALWALGGAVAPGLFGDAARDGRLHDPLATFLDLGVLCGLAAPVALRVFASGTRWTPGRLLALAAAVVLVVALGLTYSRAGGLVLLAGLATSLVAGGARLRTLGAALLTAGAAALPLAIAFSRDALGTSAADGRAAGLALLGGVVVAVAAAWFALRSEERALEAFTPQRAGASGLVLAGLAVVALAVALVALAASDRGLSGSIGHAADTLTRASPAPARGGPERLEATDSGGRRVLWSEALGAASDKPLAGWGAGSWPVVHKLYRPAATPARDARSSVLQVLAERGAVGVAVLALAVLSLLAAVALRLRALPGGQARDLTAAALGAGAGLLVALLVASTWEVPALVLPALVLLGVAAGRPDAVPHDAPAFADPDPEDGGWRWGALAAGTIVLALVATSALLPAWSHGRTQAAAGVAGDAAATAEHLRDAAADARLASKLDPPAVEPQLVAADVAQRRGRLLEARGELLKAVREQPERAEAWARLAQLALALADRPGALAAARRAVALDPESPDLVALARQAESARTPPSSSPSATGTPLPGFVIR